MYQLCKAVALFDFKTKSNGPNKASNLRCCAHTLYFLPIYFFSYSNIALDQHSDTTISRRVGLCMFYGMARQCKDY